jgi:hypothetical protein
MVKRIPKNHILVEMDCLRHKKIPFKNGYDIIIDPGFAKEQHAQTHGIVRKLPEALYFNEKDIESLEFKTPITVQEGDKVFFHYLQINKAISKNKTIYKDGKYYIFIHHDSLFFGERNNQYIMFNGWMLLKPIKAAVDEEKLYLDTLPKNRQEHDPLMGEIAFCGEPVEQYFYGSETDEGVNVKVGDKVVFLPHSDIPVEYPMHQSLEQKYFRVQRKELLSIYIN